MAPHFAVRTRCDAPDAAPDDDANGRAAHVKIARNVLEREGYE